MICGSQLDYFPFRNNKELRHYSQLKELNSPVSQNGSILCRRRYAALFPSLYHFSPFSQFPPLTPSTLELINIHNAFHQGQYQSVIDFNTSSFSPENALPARILKLRAQVALGNTDDVLADIEGETEESPSLSAVKALAQFAAGNAEAATQLAQDLAENYPDDATVQVLGGTVLQNVGKSEEALALLGKHQGNLEA